MSRFTSTSLALSLVLAPCAQAEPKLAVGQGPASWVASQVSVFSVPVNPVYTIYPYQATYGANVAFGEVDGDGIDELLTGPGPGLSLGPQVRGWSETGAP